MFKRFLLAVCALLGQNLPAHDKGGRGVYVGRKSVANLFKNVMGAGEFGTLHNHIHVLKRRSGV